MPQTAASRAYIVALVAILCLVYTVSQFLRSSTGVIAPNLSADLGLHPEELGILSGAFFLSFAIMQVPVGIFLDRYGARLTMIGSVGIAVLGCFAFALAEGRTGLTLARVLMGIGCSVMLMGPLMIYRRWFPAERFASLSGLQIAIGTIGAIGATAPLAYATETIGWRESFVAAGVFTAVLAIIMGVIVRDAPAGHASLARSPETFWQSLKGLGEVIRHPAVPPLFVMISTGYASFATVQTLWASPYLADVHGLDLGGRGNVLLGITGGQVVGLLLWGYGERLFGSIKKPILMGAFLSASILGLLALLDAPPLWLVTLLFVIFGLNAGYTPLLLTHGRLLFPDRLAGRGITVLNFGNMAGVFVLQGLTGALIGQLLRSGFGFELTYRWTFGSLALVLLAALAYYATIPDTNSRAVIDGD
ncbi:major facilitator superfamily MFS_1 [Parvibaculum lavamentivorans DS-1]|uniref:Major facilitator superfamily MFS_1 n=1 Tax=Parvibaculum lavamentivorans (strain DS-1 / DSM 13023 / NCIMB 13966) TaxID=402881 RepID=A7HUM0_PARL1|nr:MFS transporter [Parvibaculum lavamentivorans]ABS63603.1 major facilitator superfamily MFS_1 [Parvibaculum lavamentivorans DS-1]